MNRNMNESSSSNRNPFGRPPEIEPSSNRPQNSSDTYQPRTLTRLKELRLTQLMRNVYSTVADLKRFCSIEGIPLPTAQLDDLDERQPSSSNSSSRGIHSQVDALQKSVTKLQINDIRLTRRIYGYTAARGHAKYHGIDDRNMIPSSGELSVTITRKSPTNILPPRIEMFISKNESTTISRLESYFLEWNLIWKHLDILRTGPPSRSVRQHILSTFDSSIEDRTMVTVQIESSKTGGNSQMPVGCFCNPAFEFDIRPHSSIQCVLQLIACAVLYSVEEDPTDGRWIGKPVDLQYVPPYFRSLEFEKLEVERLMTESHRHSQRNDQSRNTRDHPGATVHANTRESRR